MGLRTGGISKGDTLHDETPGRSSLRRADQITRALGADARVARIGCGDLYLVELAGQVRQLVDDNLRPRADDRIAQRGGIENVDDDRFDSDRLEPGSLFGRTCRTAHDMTGSEEKPRQWNADDSGHASNKDSHRFGLTPRPQAVPVLRRSWPC